MRQIKFRAWADNKMYQDVEHNLGYYLGTKNECALMQFTGLLDKNGKEIYEGDICKIVDSADELVRIFWNDERGQFGAYHLEEFEETDFLPPYNKFEVLGNVYEDPELIPLE